jgi:hypothetical protein
LDAAGNLYGTTSIGGDPNCTGSFGEGCGTIFQLAPPAVQGGSWTETILYRFVGGTDGIGPGGLTFGKRNWFSIQPQFSTWRRERLGPFGDVVVEMFEKPQRLRATALRPSV